MQVAPQRILFFVTVRTNNLEMNFAHHILMSFISHYTTVLQCRGKDKDGEGVTTQEEDRDINCQ